MNNYKSLVNFKKNLTLPRHSWFNIKEGYSAELIVNVFNELNIKTLDRKWLSIVASKS